MPSLYHRITTPVQDFVRTYHWLVATILLGLMFGLGIFSMRGETAIVDEVAHIPSAYSYDHFGDMRLNPEHPPLIKNLAGLPLQFMHLTFPVNEPAWTTDANGQWETGYNFLYHIGNNADSILFWARLPILILGVSFGVFLYLYTRRNWGTSAGLLTLVFYALSPNIIAHARYVTTDVGASAFCFIAIAVFLRFIKVSTTRNLILLSFALAVANLAKFNAVILYPFFAVMAIVIAWRSQKFERIEQLKLKLGGLVASSVLSLVWIYIYYIPNIIHMPAAVQERLIRGSLTYGVGLIVAQPLLWGNHIAILRPFVQYFLGLFMVFGRVEGGNVTYFNQHVTNGSYHTYFFELFALKTPVPYLILMVVTAVVALTMWLRKGNSARILGRRIIGSIRGHFPEWTFGLFAAFYFGLSVAGNLNLGIRHILPIYPPLFVVVAVATVRLARKLSFTAFRGLSAVVLALLVIWYGAGTVLAYPSYTSYFNDFIGGGSNAENYFSDSGVDWGQDLLHLKTYLEVHHIKTFALDYFGGADTRYYFCNRAYDAQGKLIATSAGYDCSHTGMVTWHAPMGRYDGQYIAVSETYLENDRYYAEVNQQPSYAYLRAMTPVAKIGNSIYLYKLY